MAARTRYAPDRGLTVRMTVTMFLLGLVFVAFVAAIIGIGTAYGASSTAIVFFAVIAFCIFFPDVVLWIPKQLLPESVGCFKSPSGTGYICSQL